MKYLKIGGITVEHVITKLSEIEHDAAAIMDQVNVEKKDATQRLKQQISDFDSQLHEETIRQLDKLKKEAENEMQSQLKDQKKQAESAIYNLEQLYEENHKQYAKQLFSTMIEG